MIHQTKSCFLRFCINERKPQKSVQPETAFPMNKLCEKLYCIYFPAYQNIIPHLLLFVFYYQQSYPFVLSWLFFTKFSHHLRQNRRIIPCKAQLFVGCESAESLKKFRRRFVIINKYVSLRFLDKSI